MLLKVVGFVVVLVAASVSGNLVASSFAARTRQLGQLRVGLHLLDSEVTYAMGALPGALDRVAKGLTEPVASIFRQTGAHLRSGEGVSAGEAWERAIREAYGRTALETADVEIILALSGHLGLTDREDQRRHLKLAAERLAVREEQARDQQRSSERMWRYLGVLGGLALAVALL